ncbi:MAG: Imm49 family immunity protein [Olleya sp.]
MITIEESYLGALEREKKYINAIRNTKNYNLGNILKSLHSDNVRKFLYLFFNNKEVKKAKYCLYVAGKCDEYRFKYFKKSNPNIQRAFYNLLSDSSELINSFIDWEFNDHNYWVNQGSPVIIIQEILKDNTKKALELLDTFDDVHKKYPLKEKDSEMLRAIIKKDKKEVEKLLEFFLLTKNHKKVNDALMLSTQLFSLHATGYAKLAWIKGIEVNIEHSLLPMELLPINPNEDYEIEYDFLKPDYNSNNDINNSEKTKGIFGKWFK